jgi:hypothetical protein
VDIKRRYRFWRKIQRDTSNRCVRLRDALAPFVGRIPSRIPGFASIDQSHRTRVFISDLQFLNDVLNSTLASGRYWVWSGLLLGWAREGRVLRHDNRDADFAYAEQDEALILEGIEALVKAGFRHGYSFRNNAGQLTEYSLIRHGARFDFFRMSSDASGWEYYVYGPIWHHLPLQLTAQLPRQELVQFDFLDRTWLKPLDHELELALIYGDWKTPDPTWNYLEQGGVIGREEWTGG